MNNSSLANMSNTTIEPMEEFRPPLVSLADYHYVLSHTVVAFQHVTNSGYCSGEIHHRNTSSGAGQ